MPVALTDRLFDVASRDSSFPEELDDAPSGRFDNCAASTTPSSFSALVLTTAGPSDIDEQVFASHIQAGSLRDMPGETSTSSISVPPRPDRRHTCSSLP